MALPCLQSYAVVPAAALRKALDSVVPRTRKSSLVVNLAVPSVTAVIRLLDHRREVGDDLLVPAPRSPVLLSTRLGPLQSGRAETLVSRRHVSARLDETADPI